jgi:hypothetical protein
LSDFSELGTSIDLVKPLSLVRETLERMGVCNRFEKKFFPSCYCVGNEEEGFKIFHFKELIEIEGKSTNYNDADELRRDTIVHFLIKWNIIKADTPPPAILAEKINVLSHRDKPRYQICHKYEFNHLSPDTLDY